MTDNTQPLALMLADELCEAIAEYPEPTVLEAQAAAELLRHSERPWASATFSGTRHVIALQFAGDEGIASAEAFMEALPDHEFALSRHVVIEAAIRSVEQEMMPQARLTLEAEFLLLEDA